MKFQDLKNGRFYNEDCFEAMKEIPNGAIDMILCDLPYGTTACAWDSIIPFEPMWREYFRIAKEDAAIVLTASQPFTTALIMSQINNFKKYEWIWHKNAGSSPALAKKRPMKYHENICVFYKEQPTYNPIKTSRFSEEAKNRYKTPVGKGIVNNSHDTMKNTGNVQYDPETKSPESVIDVKTVPNATGRLHPTQKPVALFEYLIKTYTNENEIVLDNTAGSGTTAIAAINTNRKWVCIEKDADYYAKAIERIKAHQ